jgi:hypothetical protein
MKFHVTANSTSNATNTSDPFIPPKSDSENPVIITYLRNKVFLSISGSLCFISALICLFKRRNAKKVGADISEGNQNTDVIASRARDPSPPIAISQALSIDELLADDKLRPLTPLTDNLEFNLPTGETLDLDEHLDVKLEIDAMDDALFDLYDDGEYLPELNTFSAYLGEEGHALYDERSNETAEVEMHMSQFSSMGSSEAYGHIKSLDKVHSRPSAFSRKIANASISRLEYSEDIHSDTDYVDNDRDNTHLNNPKPSDFESRSSTPMTENLEFQLDNIDEDEIDFISYLNTSLKKSKSSERSKLSSSLGAKRNTATDSSFLSNAPLGNTDMDVESRLPSYVDL